MQHKLAGSCAFGALFLFISAGSANIQQHTAEVLLRPSLIEHAFNSIASMPAIDAAMVKLASLPRAAESFFIDLGAPETREPEARDSIEAPKDPLLTPLDRARAALAESTAPTLSRNELCSSLVDVAQANELPLGFFTNLIWQESRFDHVAISNAGAMGIAQFMPDVADKLGFNAFDGREALPASGKLLRTLADRFGNIGLAAAAYNAGPKRVLDWLQQRSGLPKETRDYVSLITGKPVEEWRGARNKPVVFNVPRAVPCHHTAHFSAIEQSERIAQLQRVAEERRAIERAREAARRAVAAAEALRRASAKKNKRKDPHVITARHGRSQHMAKL
jgi:soluble lytic murein transglycosylase-like protein